MLCWVDWRKVAKSWNSSVVGSPLGSISCWSPIVALVAVSSVDDDEAAERRWRPGDLLLEGRPPEQENASDNTTRRERRRAAQAAARGSREHGVGALMVALRLDFLLTALLWPLGAFVVSFCGFVAGWGAKASVYLARRPPPARPSRGCSLEGPKILNLHFVRRWHISSLLVER